MSNIFLENLKALNCFLYHIGYAKVIDNDTGEDITNMFYDGYSLITNIPIIDYYTFGHLI